MKVNISGTSVELVPENQNEKDELLRLAQDVADSYNASSTVKNINTNRAKFDYRTTTRGVEIFLD
ncbi:hypothetical protein D5E82_23960 [Vibrio parahaemolyticus]|nr:hypothetical protein FORC22_1828 [Vibrio parahaemolyticus]EGR2274730.1 hypothetical protein [Vibrio parahaemolyticus]TBT09029.1 hypothetical protein D5E82_23960 [Vibrio parahaemolyticus]TOD90159.1 hypothetical protein CGJ53_23595 [Vibrio parahaemolyticus]TOG04960.1 hypothetical protein CGJ09_22945 [Vibrio parahaemolyticus]